jgi:uncharacterized protein YaeQ
MRLQCTIQDGEMYLSDEHENLAITLDRLVLNYQFR